MVGAELLTCEFMTESHLPAVIAIESEAHPTPWTETMFRDEIGNKISSFYVLLIGAEVGGYGGFWNVAGEMQIMNIAIRRELRGLGYGRWLLRHLLEAGQRMGVTSVWLEVRQSNIAASRLYESEGFYRQGIRKAYYSSPCENAILMKRDIAAKHAERL